MNPLSKLIISVCAQRDWSWHHLSCWAIDGLSHSVIIKYCPCSSTELSKHNRAFGGSGIPLSLLGLFKHSRCVCSEERAAHEPGSVTGTRTARGHQDTTAAGPENEGILARHWPHVSWEAFTSQWVQKWSMDALPWGHFETQQPQRAQLAADAWGVPPDLISGSETKSFS